MNTVFASAFAVSALAGLASLLRGDKPLTTKTVSAHTLNSGVLGLGISLLWYSQFTEQPHVLVGLCVVAGLGGMPAVDAFIAYGTRVLTALTEKK